MKVLWKEIEASVGTKSQEAVEHLKQALTITDKKEELESELLSDLVTSVHGMEKKRVPESRHGHLQAVQNVNGIESATHCLLESNRGKQYEWSRQDVLGMVGES